MPKIVIEKECEDGKSECDQEFKNPEVAENWKKLLEDALPSNYKIRVEDDE